MLSELRDKNYNKLFLTLWFSFILACGHVSAQKITAADSAAATTAVTCTPAVQPVIQVGAPYPANSTEVYICKGGSVIISLVTKGESFEWSNGNTTTDYINVTRPGDYFARVTDANGCVAKSNIIKVVVNDKLSAPDIQVSGPTAVCESGEVTLSVPAIEGTSYYWRKDGQTIEKGVTSITVNEEGVYYLLETNSCGPAYSKNKIEFIIDHPVPAFDVTTTDPTEFCEGDSITLHAPDVPHATYIWKRNGEAFGTDSLLQVVKESGSYSVDILNTCGVYSSENELIVKMLPAPAVPEAINGRSCINTSVTISARGGTNGMYRWYTSKTGGTAIAGAQDENYTTPALSSTTTYYVAISNGQCESERQPVQAVVETQPEAPTISFTGPSTVCTGESVRLQGPSLEGMQYQWKLNGQPVKGATDSVFYAAESGSYTLSLSNTCGATTSSNAVTVTIRPPITPPTTQGSGACEAASLTLAAFGGASNGYRWYESETSPAPIPNATGSTFVTPRLTASKTYYVSIVSGECESTRVPAAAVISDVPVANAGKDVVIEQGESVSLRGSGGFSYLWEPSTGLSDPTVTNPVANPQETTTYRLTVTNEAGCQDTDEVTVFVDKALQIPNAFSPNGDGVNDTWQIGGMLEFPGVKLQVFDRWGNLVYDNPSYQNEWDGTYRGKLVPVGAYYYLFTLPSKRQKSGYLNVVQ